MALALYVAAVIIASICTKGGGFALVMGVALALAWISGNQYGD